MVPKHPYNAGFPAAVPPLLLQQALASPLSPVTAQVLSGALPVLQRCHGGNLECATFHTTRKLILEQR